MPSPQCNLWRLQDWASPFDSCRVHTKSSASRWAFLCLLLNATSGGCRTGRPRLTPAGFTPKAQHLAGLFLCLLLNATSGGCRTGRPRLTPAGFTPKAQHLAGLFLCLLLNATSGGCRTGRPRLTPAGFTLKAQHLAGLFLCLLLNATSGGCRTGRPRLTPPVHTKAQHPAGSPLRVDIHAPRAGVPLSKCMIIIAFFSSQSVFPDLPDIGHRKSSIDR